MKLRLQLTSAQRSDLKAISQAGASNLTRASEVLAALKRPLLRPAELRQAIEGNLEPDVARALVRQAVSFLTLRRKWGMETADLVESITESLRVARWEKSDLERWLAVQEPFARFLATD